MDTEQIFDGLSGSESLDPFSPTTSSSSSPSSFLGSYSNYEAEELAKCDQGSQRRAKRPRLESVVSGESGEGQSTCVQQNALAPLFVANNTCTEPTSCKHSELPRISNVDEYLDGPWETDRSDVAWEGLIGNIEDNSEDNDMLLVMAALQTKSPLCTILMPHFRREPGTSRNNCKYTCLRCNYEFRGNSTRAKAHLMNGYNAMIASGGGSSGSIYTEQSVGTDIDDDDSFQEGIDDDDKPNTTSSSSSSSSSSNGKGTKRQAAARRGAGTGPGSRVKMSKGAGGCCPSPDVRIATQALALQHIQETKRREDAVSATGATAAGASASNPRQLWQQQAASVRNKGRDRVRASLKNGETPEPSAVAAVLRGATERELRTLVLRLVKASPKLVIESVLLSFKVGK